MMIKLQKIKKPPILEENAEKWTIEYCRYIKNNQEPPVQLATKYNDLSIKLTLEKETYGKCVYCESKIKHITYGDIEHILPKNKDARPDLYVDWDNLTLACEQCNRSGKRTYYDPELPLVNPYIDEPSRYLLDIGPLVMSVAGNNRGIITENILKLNRVSLVERRKERIESVSKLLHSWAKENCETVKRLLEEQLHEEYAKDKEYSSTVKAYLKQNDFPVI